jgi:hypothetical protein
MTTLWAVRDNNLIPVSRASLDEEKRLEVWLERDPSMLGLDLMLIGRQVTTPNGGRIDLLGLDRKGGLIILELKRDKTPRDIIAQILDYASWVRTLTTKEVHEIAASYLKKPLASAFSDAFDAPLPVNLNTSPSMVAIASELDESSKRIVEYLATEHGVSINTAFFNFFKEGDREYMTADWLMNQEEVDERSAAKKQAPWSGLWYVNVGDGPTRSWEDCRSYGFIAAGDGRRYSQPLANLSVGDKIYAYQKEYGYVGFGKVTQPAMMAKDFMVGAKPLIELPLNQPNIAHDRDDADLAEYVVGVNWIKTVPLGDAKRFRGAFANQNIVCKLRDDATIEFLKNTFG